MKILGIIPARGGSKGVPGKNKKLLAGKPLVGYSIEEGLNCKHLDHLIVSTEDPEIAQISRDYGLEVPFMRPMNLASDSASSIDLVIHALAFFESQQMHYDAICLLQPTVPFREAALIDAAIKKFKSEDTDSLISVREVPHQFNPYWVFEKEDTNLLSGSKKDVPLISRRQELPAAFYRDGSIYLTKTEIIKSQRSFLGERINYIISDNTDYVNIDTMEDWDKAVDLTKNK
ncbi:MAG: acylneuraminate cytidylyltransferase family protein [Leeuwenhoekiella sp.]